MPDVLFRSDDPAASAMKSLDWGRTPLGSVALWPQGLRTALGICLASRFPMAIAWGPSLALLYNDAYRTILGAKHPSAMGQPFYEVSSELVPIVRPMFEGVLRTGKATWSDDLLLPVRRHGYEEEAYFTLSFSAIRDDSSAVGGIFITIAETTERVLGHRREQFLRDLADRAGRATSPEEAAGVLASIVRESSADISRVAIYLADGERRLGLVDVAQFRLGELPAVVSSPQLSVGDRDLQSSDMDSLLRSAALAGAPTIVPARALVRGGGDEPLALIPIGRPQHERFALVVAGLNPRREVDAAYRGFLTSVGRQLETALASATAYAEERDRARRLAELDAAKSAFFANVSHEFRTPLTLMLGPLEEMLGRGEGGDIELIHRNALRLDKLVNDLLDFARLEGGRSEASFSPTDLAAMTRDLASGFRAAIERAGLVFDTSEIEDPGELVWVDPDMWEKIVLNLLSNAYKFTLDGKISVALRRAGPNVVVSVSDTGVGIAPSELPRVFERFHRIEGTPARTHEGSGIGLALVQSLVELHGGQITVESVYAQGSTFTITLPFGDLHLPEDRKKPRHASRRLGLARAYAEEARWWTTNPVSDSTPPRAPQGTEPGIIVADDNADMRAYLTRILSRRWRVRAVSHGIEALQAAKAEPPDLVIADVMMPGVDGLELVRELRLLPATSSTRLVLLSARADEDARVDGLRAGADDYLVKPFSARELLAKVETFMELARLRRRADAVRDEERRFLATVLDQIPSAVIIADPSGKTLFANAQVDAILGYPAVRTETVADFGRYTSIHADGTPYAAEEYALARALRGEVIVDEERRFVRGDGAVRIFSVSAKPVLAADGQMVAAVNVVSDVTERKQIDEERQELLVNERRLRAQAEVASRTKDEFLAMLGHELRNPLAPIVTALHLMKGKTGGTEREQEVIERQVRHLVRLVDDLLDVSRIARGKVELRKAEVDVADVVADAIETTSPLFEQRSHRVTVVVPRGELFVYGDSARLAQILANLLSNAAKYTESGGSIDVSAAREGDEVVLRVKDDGEGISPELLPRIFDLFEQGTRTIERAAGGLGLGLALVKNLVQLHGGSVVARSDGPHTGTELVVRLPALREDATPLSEEPPSSASLPAAVAVTRVLIVDDNDDAAEMLGEVVAGLGHAVRIAHDGPSALALAETFVPTIALVDIGLPLMDGYEVGRRLTAMNPDLGLLIAVTGYGQASDVERSRDAGFHHHLVKPVDLRKLLGLLRTHVEAR